MEELVSKGEEGGSHRQEGVLSGAEQTDGAFKGTVKAAAGYEGPLRGPLSLQTEPLGSSALAKASHCLLQPNLHHQQAPLPAPDVNFFSVCGSMPPPTSAGGSLLKFSTIFPAAFDHKSKLSQGIAGELSTLGETPSKGRGGRGRGRGGRGRGRSGQYQDNVIAASPNTLDSLSAPEHSNKRGSSGSKSTEGRKVSSREKGSLDQPIGAPVHLAAPLASVGGGLSFLEQGRSSDFFKSTEVIERVPDLRCLDMSGVCGALPPAQCMPGLATGAFGASPLHIEDQRSQGALSHHSVVTPQDITKTAPMEISFSRGRGGQGRGRVRGGRGRGRSGVGEDHIGSVLPSDDCTSKGKTCSQGGAIPTKSSVPTFAKDAFGEGKEFSFPRLRSPQEHINEEISHGHAYSTKARVSSIGDSSHPPPITQGLTPRDLNVDEQSGLGDDVARSPDSPSSLQGGTLQQELAEFLMPAGADPITGVQSCKSARKRTKSRKVLENENLWRELTAAPKAGGSTFDPTVKDTGNISEHFHAQSAHAQSPAHAEELNGVPNKKELFGAHEGDGFGEVSMATCGVKESSKGIVKKRKGQGLKERARIQRPAPQDQHDAFRCLHQASDIDMLAAEQNSAAPEGDSTHTEDVFSDYDSIEVVENWQSYCPFAPSSPNLIHVYEDGGPTLASLPIFGSSRATPCADKTWPDYYDLVLNAGGSIWALDWCPHRIHTNDCRREFLAVGAHPHDSSTHRLGEQVQGKGLIQIWAFDLPYLSQAQASWNYDYLSRVGRGKQKPRGGSRARGRPKKIIPEDEELRDFFVGDVGESVCSFEKSSLLYLEDGKLDVGVDMDAEGGKVDDSSPVLPSALAVEEFDPPQMVLGLAHDAGLVWDAKWQPVNANFSGASSRLGYIAAVFGDGSMQVFDIPLPSLIRKLKFSSLSSSAPFVVTMKPVFKCSGLSSGGQKSLPLTIEWSASPPHNLLLVGCNDGAVALWMFDPRGSNDHDARPLTCFVADTAPIRALAFAPDGTDVESRSVVVTGGHSGRLLFWDLRDPFYPLWDLSLSKGGCILSIDWLSYPRGIILSMDDGTIKTLSLEVALYDSPLTGTPPPKSLSQGMHTTFSSDYAVWSVHVSRASGIAIYAGEDGSIVHCQLTEKYFVNDRARAREPHFLCCKLIEDSASGVLSLESINSDAPLQVKNQRADSKQVPLTKAFSRRASGGMYEEEDQPKKKPAAIKRKFSLLEGKETDDEDFSFDEVDPLALVPYDPNTSVKPKAKSRSLSTTVGKDNNRGRKAGKDGTPSLSSGRDADALPDGGGSTERVPSKAVAVHRVRWNQNKGCESLVCFGGAAGIVRCQLIMPRAL